PHAKQGRESSRALRPTERYVRGVLGDGLEAESVSVLNPGEDTVESFRAESSGVFEALAPL
ncbi:MAG: hypothetical protein M3117_03490, partial [Actinomycetota bacterium]|nr:hypothetical protein [Actinomycetota bacterium]